MWTFAEVFIPPLQLIRITSANKTLFWCHITRAKHHIHGTCHNCIINFKYMYMYVHIDFIYINICTLLNLYSIFVVTELILILSVKLEIHWFHSLDIILNIVYWTFSSGLLKFNISGIDSIYFTLFLYNIYMPKKVKERELKEFPE